MLYDHARECGADAREGHEVVKVEQSGPRDTRLDVSTDDGRSYSIQARYVVDASGRDAFLSVEEEAAAQERPASKRRHLRPLPRRRTARGRGRGQHQHLQLRAWLDVDDSRCPTA